MTSIIISLIGTWLAIQQAPPALVGLWTNTANIVDLSPCTVTLEIPQARPYVQTGSILLFHFTDSEWEIITNTFSDSIRTETNGVISFCGTNQWCRTHQWKKP